MVLNGATMKFEEGMFNFCGSLGSLSYFDEKCPAQIQDSKLTFTTSSGELLVHSDTYQCKSL